IFYLQSSGVKLIGATEKAKQNIFESDLSGSTAFVMGGEEKGIHHSLVKMLDETAKIPLMGSINSLNVSVACGMFLYENLKQKRTK
ncbi:MAG: 23S rRNA (guanosine(2251)-2'-O)-methyltransferase RlmB, partial [Psychroflexus sp.]|nr:23S rRNA (guanosine(2251)-2'-O)-methyltransferase RlmB [Psychroflexus sp.]